MRNQVMVYGAFQSSGGYPKKQIKVLPVQSNEIQTSTDFSPALKLKEIIWEITPECNKNCSYCGSKNLRQHKMLSINQLMLIAKRISDYKVEEVTLSGGEPGLVACLFPDEFRSIINMLHKSGTKVKIVTNGEFFKSKFGGIDLDVVGVSVNDLEGFNDIISKNPTVNLENYTMITNFGTHNIWRFDDLFEIARDNHFKCWQIQLTMGEFLLPPDGIEFLRNKISSIDLDKIPEKTNLSAIVLADNLQTSHCCSAGIRSCGILWNGGVVGCLAERSYSKINYGIKSYGNILEKDLRDIWESGEWKMRFSNCRDSCRDCIRYPKYGVDIKSLEAKTDSSNEIYNKSYNPGNIVCLYSVQSF